MNNDEKIVKILADMQANMATKADVERIEKRMDTLDDTQNRIVTSLDAVKAGIDDVQTKQKAQATKQAVEATVEAAKADLKVELAAKADILDLAAKIDKNTKSYKIRLEELEKDAGIRNRDKN